MEILLPSNGGMPIASYPTLHTTKPQPKRLERVGPRILIIGAGYRGHAYAGPIHASGEGNIAAVVEPVAFKRQAFGETYIWGATGNDGPREGEEFDSWEDYIKYEMSRRERVRAGGTVVDPGIDAVFVCVLDELHAPVVKGLAPLGLHIMCEKPLATRLEDSLGVYAALERSWNKSHCRTVFAVGYVLRYSYFFMLLRKLVREDRVVGDVISVEHTEPVGWWHFGHSYVRGSWRKESTSAPSLLTKSCHDIDLLLWLLCSPTSPSSATNQTHLPSKVTSSGRLHFYRRAHKPLSAGTATNCLSCPIEPTCLHSAKSLYLHRHLETGNTDRPVNAVVPDIEDMLWGKGKVYAAERLLEALGEDYDESTLTEEVNKRNWFGRCVWECDNDVCDDQIVTMEWDDDPLPSSQHDQNGAPTTQQAIKVKPTSTHKPYVSKTAHFHMTALTDAIGARRGRISGTTGEISYDSTTIRVIDFSSGEETVHETPQTGDGHCGGDEGLALEFVRAVASVKSGEMEAEEAQMAFLGCTPEELLRSHLAVFWAEEARTQGVVLEWEQWWGREVEKRLREMGVEVRE